MAETLIKIIKFILGILLLPVLVAVTISAHFELAKLDQFYYTFHWGVVIYLIFHLFIYTPATLYQTGQRIFSEMFKFSQVVGAIMTYGIPLFAALALIVLYICSVFLDMTALKGYFVFLSGFFAAMHIVLTARDLYEDDEVILKPNYFSSIVMIYIANLLVVSFLLYLNFEKFSFSSFIADMFERSGTIYAGLFSQLF